GSGGGDALGWSRHPSDRPRFRSGDADLAAVPGDSTGGSGDCRRGDRVAAARRGAVSGGTGATRPCGEPAEGGRGGCRELAVGAACAAGQLSAPAGRRGGGRLLAPPAAIRRGRVLDNFIESTGRPPWHERTKEIGYGCTTPGPSPTAASSIPRAAARHSSSP